MKNEERIEKVVKILKEVYWEEFDYSQPDWKRRGEKWFRGKAVAILNLKVPRDTDEEIVQELCKVLAIRYGYADGETIDWIMKNVIPLILSLKGEGGMGEKQPTQSEEFKID